MNVTSAANESVASSLTFTDSGGLFSKLFFVEIMDDSSKSLGQSKVNMTRTEMWILLSFVAALSSLCTLFMLAATKSLRLDRLRLQRQASITPSQFMSKPVLPSVLAECTQRQSQGSQPILVSADRRRQTVQNNRTAMPSTASSAGTRSSVAGGGVSAPTSSSSSSGNGGSSNKSSKRFNNYPPSNEYASLIGTKLDFFLEAAGGSETTQGWSFINETDGLRKFKRDIPGSKLAMYKGEKLLNFPPFVCFNAICDYHVRQTFSDDLDTIGLVTDIDESTKIEFEKYKVPAPFVSARDFCYVTFVDLNREDGSIVSIATSIEHSGFPVNKKYVRATLNIGGWLLKPVVDEPGQCLAVYLVHVDLGGSLPSSLLNGIASMIPNTVERLNQYLLKNQDRTRQFREQGTLPWMSVDSDSITDDNDGKEKENQAGSTMDAIPERTDGIQIDYGVGFEPSDPPFETYDALQNYFDEFIDDSLNSDPDSVFCKGGKYYEFLKKQPSSWIDQPFTAIDDTAMINGRDYLKEFRQTKETHRYSAVLQASLDMFHDWHSTSPSTVFDQEGLDGSGYAKSEQEWRQRVSKKEIQIYSRPVYGETIEVLKGQSVFPYSSNILAGILMNANLRLDWDDKLEEIQMVERLSAVSNIVYISVLTPRIIAQRDMVALVYIYAFPDGQWLMGSVSVDHPDRPPVSSRVRAQITTAVWHLKPIPKELTPDGKNHCIVTYYAHVKLGGSLPEWLVNQVSTDMPMTVLDLKKYLKKKRSVLHTPEILWLTPVFLSCHGIPVSINSRLAFAEGALRMGINIGGPVRIMLEALKNGQRLDTDSSGMIVESFAKSASTIDEEVKSGEGSSIHSGRAMMQERRVKKTVPVMRITREQWTMGKGIAWNDIPVTISEMGSSTASLLTFGACAVDELLKQVSPDIKHCWVPTETDAPQGIFVYKFSLADKGFSHYMGKAILKHEPRYIFDALCQPSFRFYYDSMIHSMEIIEKIDQSTHLAKYVHQSSQCYMKISRTSILLVKHKEVLPGDKYVVVGKSVELSGMESSNMEVRSSGWLIERNAKNPRHSIVSYITNTNVGGMVPISMANSLAKKQPMAIYYLGKALKTAADSVRRKREAAKMSQSLPTVKQAVI